MQVRIIHTADIHLGAMDKNTSFTSDVARLRYREIKETFYRLIELVHQKKPDFFIISGDLFDNNNIRPGDIRQISETFKTLQTNIIIVCGNHDPLNNNSYYNIIKFPDNVHIVDSSIKKIEFENLNTTIWGYSFNKHYVSDNILKHINLEDKNKINIFVCHGDVYNENSNYLPLSIDRLKKIGFDYVALGHIHKKDIIDNLIVYPGSLEPIGFGETGTHGYIEAEIEKNKKYITFIPFSKRQFVDKEIMINESMKYYDIKNHILNFADKKDRKNNIYRIVLKGYYDTKIELNEKDIVDDIKDDFFYVKVIDESIKGYDFEKIKKENSENIIGEFLTLIDESKEDEEIKKDAKILGIEELLNIKGGK